MRYLWIVLALVALAGCKPPDRASELERYVAQRVARQRAEDEKKQAFLASVDGYLDVSTWPLPPLVCITVEDNSDSLVVSKSVVSLDGTVLTIQHGDKFVKTTRPFSMSSYSASSRFPCTRVGVWHDSKVLWNCSAKCKRCGKYCNECEDWDWRSLPPEKEEP